MSTKSTAFANLMGAVRAQITPAHLKLLAWHYTELMDEPVEFKDGNELLLFLCTDRSMTRDNITPLLDALTLCPVASTLVEEYLREWGGGDAPLGPHTKCMPKEHVAPREDADDTVFRSVFKIEEYPTPTQPVQLATLPRGRQVFVEITPSLVEPTDTEYARLLSALEAHFPIGQLNSLSVYYSALFDTPQHWPTAAKFFQVLTTKRGLSKTNVGPLAEAMAHCSVYPAARKLLAEYGRKHGVKVEY